MNLIFCDESCHLQYDGSDIMVLGGIKCWAEEKNNIYNEITKIKEKYGLHKNSEVKWTKVSKKYKEMYKEIIDYVMGNDDIKIRILLVVGKKYLNHESYSQTHNDWYYKIYYHLLGNVFNFSDNSKVFIDIKDTCGGDKIQKLKTILNSQNKVFGIYQIRSNESQLLQVIDLIIGITSYYKRVRSRELLEIKNTKQELVEYFRAKYNSLDNNSPLSNKKFNFFIWDSSYGGRL